MVAKKNRIEFIIATLEELYPNPPIPLNHQDSYTLLIAVLLSAQCTDERVNKVTKILFAKANTPEKMVLLGEKKIQEIIRPCGLSPKKSKAIFELSQILINDFNSIVPQSFEDLESFPGVGHKTASVVMAQSFGVAAFPVDTHIHRLGQRWGLTNGQSVAQTEKDLKKAFPKELWNKLHLQIIYYGREYCSARGCDGTKCKICQFCFPNRKVGFNYRRA